MMAWLDNGFHFALIAVAAWIFLVSPFIAVFSGHFIHEGMGDDGQEGGAR